MNDKVFQVLGMMSGTSMDGLDLAHCTFSQGSEWAFKINKATTVSYPEEILERLKKSTSLSGLELAQLNVDLGKFMGSAALSFLDQHHLKVDFLSSHGHTVFHQPDKSLTLQIGSPAHISAITGLRVVADFRTTDVALGGNGAPLVPVGDELLFADFDVCLNLGGIANLSYTVSGTRKAYDVGAFNLVFNYLAGKLGKDYDKDGLLAAGGAINGSLIRQLNELPFYQQKGPKSLGWEWVSGELIPLIDNCDDTPQNLMRTYCEHVAGLISSAFPAETKRVLVTGGGAFHKTFISELRKQRPEIEIHLPSDELINFKEALVFAFLAVLRWTNSINCLKSVTGASRDNVGGAIYL